MSRDGDPKASRRRARRGEGQQLREEILVAATCLLEEKGTEDAVSIRDVADAVGVTPPSIYLHFADKAELLAAVCRDPSQELHHAMTSRAMGATSPRQELRRLGEAYIRFGVENPEKYRTMFMGSRPGAGSENVANWAALTLVRDTVQRCMDAGLMARSDALAVTLTLWASVHGITSLEVAMPQFPWPPLETMISQVLDACEVALVS